MRLSFILFVLLTPFLCGCQTIGHFGPLMNSQTPDTSSLVSHIECEIYQTMVPDPKHPAIDNYRLLTENRYIAYAILTLDVTSNEGFNPSVNFISPYRRAMTNFTLAVAGQLTGVQHKNIQQSFTIVLDPTNISPAQYADYCSEKDGVAGGLAGNLGLNNIIEAGLYHATESEFLFPLPKTNDAAAAAAHLSQSLAPTFGSTIDFTITYGISSAGPTWTITHFKGPGGGTTGLVNATRVVKDTLVISFAPARPQQANGGKAIKVKSGTKALTPNLKGAPSLTLPASDPVADDLAARAAQVGVTTQLLQNIPGLNPTN